MPRCEMGGALVIFGIDAGDAIAIEGERENLRVCEHLEIGSAQYWAQISHGGAAPAARFRCELEVTDTFLINAIIIGV